VEYATQSALISQIYCYYKSRYNSRAKLTREEEARQKGFQARMDALASFSKSYENRVGRTQQQQKAENDKIIAADLEESDRKRAERERTDLERRRQHSLQNTEYNIMMMEKKKKAQEDERLEAISRRQQLEQEAAEQRRKDREGAERRRVQQMDLRGMLDQQVAQRQHGERNAAALTGIEATINKVCSALSALFRPTFLTDYGSHRSCVALLIVAVYHEEVE
jgi:hypothetical protein